MSRDIDAIYDQGILRLIVPLDLREGERVRLHIDDDNRDDENRVQHVTPVSELELREQQAALDAMFREVDRLPQVPQKDGLSGRDHDRILYGGVK